MAQILGLDSFAAVTKGTVTGAADLPLTTLATVSRTELDGFHQSYGFRLCPDLDEQKRYQVLDMLHGFTSVFVRDMTEIKQCKAEPMKLELHTDRKILNVNID